MNSNEFKTFFLNVISRQTNCDKIPDVIKNNPELFFNFLQKNHIFELYYYFCFDSDFRDKQKIIYQQSIIKNQKKIFEAKSLVKKYGSRIIFLKGISLLHSIYKTSLARYISDIDILIENYDEFKEFLLANNFTQVHSYPETFRNGEIKIDIHTDLINQTRNIFQGKIININDKKILMKNIVNIENNIYRLNNDLEYLYLVSHLYIHHNLNDLRWIADIILYNKEMELDFRNTLNLINSIKIGKIYIFHNNIFYNYLGKRIPLGTAGQRKYNIIGKNRYLTHLYFMEGFINRINYIIFIMLYVIKNFHNQKIVCWLTRLFKKMGVPTFI